MNKLSLLILLFYFFSTISFAQDITMAVWEFDAKNVKRVEVEILVDRLTTKLAQIGQYTVIERTKMKEVLEEQGFQQSGVCGNECVVEVGNMLGVSVMVTGSIGKLGDFYTIDARAISVETGKILNQASQDWEGKISEVLTEVIPVIAQQLSGQVVSLKIKKEPQVNYSQRKGTLYIESTPSQAKVWVDDILIDGITPLTVPDLNVGDHTIRLELGDYFGSKSLSIIPDEINKTMVLLLKANSNLSIYTTPSGASVSLGGKKQIDSTPLTVKDLPVGNYVLEISKIGYYTHRDTVKIKKDEVNSYSLTLEKLPTITINVNPSDATIRIDLPAKTGRFINRPLEDGQHTLQVSKNGYMEFKQNFSLERDEQKTINVELIPYTGTIAVREIYPTDAQLDLYNDKNIKVETGFGVASFDWEILIGQYHISITRDGYLPVEKDLQVLTDSYTEISETLLSIESINDQIKSRKMKGNLFLFAGIIAGLGGSYLRTSADKHYAEYLVATTNAGDLRKKVEMEDTLNPIFFGLSGPCFFLSTYYHKKNLPLNKLLDDGVIRK